MASLNRLNQPLKLGAVTTKNRICIPPMVLFGHGAEDGMVTDDHVNHYAALAAGGAGLVIQEATCISPEGRLSMEQLGIWSDDHIEGLRRITDAVHAHGCPIFVQLHHGGIMSCGGEKLCPSSYRLRQEKQKFVGRHPVTEVTEVVGREMTRAEIETVKRDFVSAAARAEEAGYDGVELHGCHSYLLSQFLNSRVNRREDEYGDGIRLVVEILEELRRVTGPDFVIGIRLGGFEPDLSAALEHAKVLKEHGIAFLDISYGFTGEMVPEAPGPERLKPIIRAAAAIRAAVEVPTFAVDGIRTPEAAEEILTEAGVDMVDIGRSALVDPNWAEKALAGMVPGCCLGCKVCQWRIDKTRCPGRQKIAKKFG